MLRTALSTYQVAVLRLRARCCRSIPPSGAFKRVLGLSTPAEAQAEGGSGASVNFLLFLRNSIIYATLSTVGQVFFCALAAYAFARLAGPGGTRSSCCS